MPLGVLARRDLASLADEPVGIVLGLDLDDLEHHERTEAEELLATHVHGGREERVQLGEQTDAQVEQLVAQRILVVDGAGLGFRFGDDLAGPLLRVDVLVEPDGVEPVGHRHCQVRDSDRRHEAQPMPSTFGSRPWARSFATVSGLSETGLSAWSKGLLVSVSTLPATPR